MQTQAVKGHIIAFMRRYKITRLILNCRSVIKRRIKYLFSKKRFSYGELNADKTFYIISFSGGKHGIINFIINFVVPNLLYAKKHAYIPIIDVTESELPGIQMDGDRGHFNAWEHYFLQYQDYSLEEVYRSKNVVKMTGFEPGAYCDSLSWKSLLKAPESELFGQYRGAIRQYVRPVSDISDRVNDFIKDNFPKGKNILAVNIRVSFRWGAMVNNSLYNGHLKVDSCEYYIKETEKKMKEWGCEYLFFAVDERSYHDKFKGYFGEKFISLDRPLSRRFKYEGNDPERDTAVIRKEFENTTVIENVNDYLTEAYIMSACHSFYGFGTSNGVFAYLQKKGMYEHMEIYDKGFYSGLTD